MKYDLIDVSVDKVDILINYKLDTIINDNISEDEKKKIISYVKDNSLKRINDSKFIIVNKKIVGCMVLYNHLDGVLLDELYLESDYRNLKIGTSILNDIIKNNGVVYLWVYKDNRVAFNLYSKLNLKVIEETETRYFMKHTYV